MRNSCHHEVVIVSPGGAGTEFIRLEPRPRRVSRQTDRV